MENVTLERAVEVARALKPEEQRQLRALIDSWQKEMPAETTPEQGQRLAEHLLAQGAIERVPARYREGYNPEQDADQHPAISVQGRPVSETLLEDREPF